MPRPGGAAEARRALRPAHRARDPAGIGPDPRNPLRGLLLAVAHARRCGHELIVPHANAAEARAAAPAQVRAAGHLLEVCAYLTGAASLPLGPDPPHAAAAPLAHPPWPLDLRDVHGQLQAKRALLIAAAGAHSLLKLESIGP